MKYTCQIQCEPLRSVGPLLINIQREKTEIFFENTNKFKLYSAYYTLHLRPPIRLRNALPVDIAVSVAGTAIKMNEELDKILQMDIDGESMTTPLPSTNVVQHPTQSSTSSAGQKKTDFLDDEMSMQSLSDQFIRHEKTRNVLNDVLLNYGEKEVKSGHSLYLPTMKIHTSKNHGPSNYLVIKVQCFHHI